MEEEEKGPAAGPTAGTNNGDNQVEKKRYKGVRKRKWGKWVSEIRLPNSRERIWLGSYDSPEKAARAFDAATFYLRGCKAAPRFNFPHSIPDIRRHHHDGPMNPAEIQLAASNFANLAVEQNPPPPADDSSTTIDQRETLDWSFLNSLDASSSSTFPMDDLLYDHHLTLPALAEDQQCYYHSSLWDF